MCNLFFFLYTGKKKTRIFISIQATILFYNKDEKQTIHIPKTINNSLEVRCFQVLPKPSNPHINRYI